MPIFNGAITAPTALVKKGNVHICVSSFRVWAKNVCSPLLLAILLFGHTVHLQSSDMIFWAVLVANLSKMAPTFKSQ